MKLVESLIVACAIALSGTALVTSAYNSIAVKRLETHLEEVERRVDEVCSNYGFGFSDIYID